MEKSKFINEVVLGWIKSDLLRMVAFKPEPFGKGNINFPLALCALADMEYLGGFLLGKDEGFTNNVGKYLEDCFLNKEEYPVKILGELFRNGLAHEYFSRGAVSRNGKHPAIYKGNNFDVVLDAETLATDFINSLNIFIGKLDDDRYSKRMEESLKKIKQLKDDYKDLLICLGCQLNDDDTATPSVGLLEENTTTSSDKDGCFDKLKYTTTDPSLK